MKKISNKSDMAVSVIFVLLIVSALILTSSYMMIISDDFSSEMPWDAASYTGYRFSSVDNSNIVPYMMYFQSGDNGRAIISNERLTREYYSDLSPYVAEGFTKGKMSQIPSGAAYELSETLRASDCVYISYPSCLPLYLYVYYASGQIPLAIVNNPVAARLVFGVFIVANENGYYTAAVCDNGDIIVSSPISSNLSAPTERIASEASSDRLIRAHFAYRSDEDLFAVSYDDDISVENVIINGASDFDFTSILKLFGYNPDKVSTYTESGDTTVYVASFGLLKKSPDRIVFEASGDDGILCGDYIKIANDPSIFDLLSVSDGFISSVRSSILSSFGGGASIRLGGISYDSGVCAITYTYAFDNISLDDKTAAELIFTNGTLTYAEFDLLSAENDVSRTTLMKSSLIFDMYQTTSKSMSGGNVNLEYRIDGGMAYPEWIILGSEGASK